MNIKECDNTVHIGWISLTNTKSVEIKYEIPNTRPRNKIASNGVYMIVQGGTKPTTPINANTTINSTNINQKVTQVDSTGKNSFRIFHLQFSLINNFFSFPKADLVVVQIDSLGIFVISFWLYLLFRNHTLAKLWNISNLSIVMELRNIRVFLTPVHWMNYFFVSLSLTE